MSDTEQKKKSGFKLGKLMLTCGIVFAAAAATNHFLNKDDINLNNLQEASVSQAAKDCTIMSIQSMKILASRSIEHDSYSSLNKRAKPALEELVAPFENNGVGKIDLNNIADADVKSILKSCNDDTGYLNNVKKVSLYVIESEDDHKTRFKQDKSSPNIKINIEKPTDTQGAMLSYKFKS